MKKIEFKVIHKTTSMLNPKTNFERVDIPSEIRIDPLTGRSARICHFMKLKWDKIDLMPLVKAAGDFCPFCPENVEVITPKFLTEIFEGGRIKAGDSIVFPNMAPYDGHSGVCVMGKRHYVPMTELSSEMIVDGLTASTEYLRILRNKNCPDADFGLINWNYMPPSGSSLIHPHLQIYATSNIGNIHREELSASKKYYAENKRNYWDALIDEEIKNDERYLGTIGRVNWFNVFSPVGVAGDVIGIVKSAYEALDLTVNDFKDIAKGLLKMFKIYDSMGIYSFNLAFFPGYAGQEFYTTHFKIVPRVYFNRKLASPDTNTLKHIYDEPITMAFPEELCREFKPYF